MISRGLLPKPVAINEIVDKRIGDAYPAVEIVARELERIQYIADNLHLNSPYLELRGNAVLKCVEWRLASESDDPNEGWKFLFNFSDISLEMVNRLTFVEQLYTTVRNQGNRLESELDKVKAFVNYQGEVNP